MKTEIKVPKIMLRRLKNLLVPLALVTLLLNGCLRGNDSLVDVDDGIYIKGKSTAFIHFDGNGLMKPAVNEVTGQLRQGLYEIFIAVSSESDGFNIIQVLDKTQTIYGPSTSESVVLNGENGQIYGAVKKGIFSADAGVFTVPENGIYHIIIDKQNSTYVISPVNNITLYKHLTGGEWHDTVIPLKTSFDKINMMFEIAGLDFTTGEFRFRYGHGDKIEIIGNEVKAHTSFGGIISGTLPDFELSMVPGGTNYSLDAGSEGKYTMNVIWSVGQGFAAQLLEGSSSYPEHLFIIGDGISALSGNDAWNWDLNNFEMIPVYSQSHLFWKIVWLNKSGGVRFAPQKGPENEFGKEGEGEDGLYNMGGQDVPVTGTEGFYMIVVNFQSNQVSITRPEVYLIGDAVGSWDPQNVQAMFSVQDAFDVVYLKKKLDAGNIRMYAWHSKGWFTYWWNTEFNVYSGGIKYVGFDYNLQPVSVINGVYEIKLNFKTGEGAIDYCASCSK
jgi:hypothetical protein